MRMIGGMVGLNSSWLSWGGGTGEGGEALGLNGNKRERRRLASLQEVHIQPDAWVALELRLR